MYMMKQLYSLLKKNIFLFVVLSIFSSFLLLLVPQQESVLKVATLFDFFSYAMLSSLWYFITSAFLAMPISAQILFIATTILLSVNIILLIIYLRVYRKLLSTGSTGLSAFGLIAAIFTTGCLSCSVALIAPLISIFGLSAGLWASNHTQTIALIALMSIGFSCYLLLKKLQDPQICTTDYE